MRLTDQMYSKALAPPAWSQPKPSCTVSRLAHSPRLSLRNARNSEVSGPAAGLRAEVTMEGLAEETELLQGQSVRLCGQT
jgi:hypothetical protein